MQKISLFFHYFFRFIWNAVFVISYPIIATFGILFIGLTYVFSAISRLLAGLKKGQEEQSYKMTDWVPLPQAESLLEAKPFKQIVFGPTCFQLRRVDGVPSVLQDHIFGSKVKFMEEGLLLEKWNTTDSKLLPDFDICLYNPDRDTLTPLTTIKCFDWHLSGKEDNRFQFKWFDGIQGGEVSVAI